METLLHHMLRNMNLTIGYGKNYFTMNRGSFHYRKMVRWRRDLKRTGYTKTADGFVLAFLDEKENREYFMDITVKDGHYKAEMRSCPDHVNRFWVRLPSGANEHIYGCGERGKEGGQICGKRFVLLGHLAYMDLWNLRPGDELGQHQGPEKAEDRKSRRKDCREGFEEGS